MLAILRGRRRRALATVVGGAVIAGTVALGSGHADAAVTAPFARTNSYEGHLDAIVIGTSNHTDELHCGMTQRSAALNLPAGTTVKAARLTWAGDGAADTTVNLNGTPVVGAATRIVTRASAYFLLIFERAVAIDYYKTNADVTDTVRSLAKPGATTNFTVSGISSGTRLCNTHGALAAWTLTVIVEGPGYPNRRVNLYDAAMATDQYPSNQPLSLTSALDGLAVQAECPANRIIISGYEGDSYKGDDFFLAGVKLDTNWGRGSTAPNLDIKQYDNRVAPGSTSISLRWTNYRVRVFVDGRWSSLAKEVQLLGNAVFVSDACDLDPDPSAVGDRVWRDTDGNGVQDNGEPGIGGVDVALLRPDGTTVASTSTDAAGNYLFDGLAPGSYRVRFATDTLPAGCAVVPADRGGDDTRDSDAAADGTTPQVTLAAGDRNLTVDLGCADVSTVSALGDRVWRDTNRNGIHDAGEVGIGGVAVVLRRADGSIAAVADTDADGNYLFDDLVPGSYRVRFLPASVADGCEISPVDQTEDTADSDADADGNTAVVTLAPGDRNLTVDLGCMPAVQPT